MEHKKIVGSWSLVNHGKFNEEGVYTPTADQIVGKLIYANDGAMSVLIVKCGDAKALSDLIVYSGRYSIDGDTINHHIEIAPRAARRNTTEIRFAELKNDILILRTPKLADGFSEIQWRREK